MRLKLSRVSRSLRELVEFLGLMLGWSNLVATSRVIVHRYKLWCCWNRCSCSRDIMIELSSRYWSIKSCGLLKLLLLNNWYYLCSLSSNLIAFIASFSSREVFAFTLYSLALSKLHIHISNPRELLSLNYQKCKTLFLDHKKQDLSQIRLLVHQTSLWPPIYHFSWY